MITGDFMNGRWSDFKAELQRVWGQLNNDELEGSGGDLSTIGKLIDEKYGLGIENVRQRLDAVTAEFRRRLKEERTETGLDEDTAGEQEVPGLLHDRYRQF